MSLPKATAVIRVPLPRALSPNTAEVFNFLLRVNQECNLNVTLRVAGGWVRDMVMNRENDDIDIAIESPSLDKLVSGEKFAEAIARMQEKGTGAHATVSVIKTNPDQSKHIETAQIKVLGNHLEFCHLRQDDYTEAHQKGHRTPQVKPASPLEDALRRDFTCNALFYNLHTAEVEDYVGGLEDISNRVLRCPLEPHQTFLDDPLRMLRGVRFAGQLGFGLHESIVNCLLEHQRPVAAPHFDPFLDGHYTELASVLWSKVSRERASIELVKCLHGRDPAQCHWLMSNLGLIYPCVLVEQYVARAASKSLPRMTAQVHPLLPEACSTLPDPAKVGTDFYSVASQMLLRTIIGCATSEIPGIIHSEKKSHERLVTSLFCILQPLLVGPRARPTACYSTELQPDLKTRTEAIILNSMKLPVKVTDAVYRMLAAYHQLLSVQPMLVRLLLAASGEESNGKEDAQCALMTFQGEIRNGAFTAIRRFSKFDSPLLVEAVFAAIVISGCQRVSDGSMREAVSLCLSALRQDRTLLSCYTLLPLVKGDELLVYLPIDKPQLCTVLEEELRYMVMHGSTPSKSVSSGSVDAPAMGADSSSVLAAVPSSPNLALPTVAQVIAHLQSIYGTR